MSFKAIKTIGAALALYLLAGNWSALAQNGRGANHWVGTWAAAVVARPQAAPAGGQGGGRGQAAALNFNNQTLRQIVHASIGGNRIRVVLSNAFGTAPLPVGAANIALRQKDAAIVASSSSASTWFSTSAIFGLASSASLRTTGTK